jgi:PleD family two-component response regulator
MDKPKILIVDDDTLIRDVFRNSFTKEGFLVEDASDGSSAMSLIDLKDFKPDAVLTGIIMTPMGGFEMIEQLRAQEALKNTIYVVLSHRGKEEDKQRAQELGVKDFIISGITPPDEVARRVKSMLGLAKSFKLDIKFEPGENDANEFAKEYPELLADVHDKMVAVMTPITEQGDNVFKVVFEKHSKLTS